MKQAPKLLLVLPLLLLLVLAGLYGYSLGYDPNNTGSRLVGKAVPAFSLPSLSDTGVMLDSASIKGPALINVWASWCAACRAEHAELKRIAAEEGVKVYGIDYQDEAAMAQAWLEQNGNPFTWVMFDGAAALALPLDIVGLPQSYFVDAQGVVRARHIGAMTKAVWSAKL